MVRYFPWSPVKPGYSCYALEHMIHTRGRDRFQEYLLRVMQNPDQARAVFPEYFNVSFDGAVREFRAAPR
jgi:hypothetical protein